jgi:cell division protein FtsQ
MPRDEPRDKAQEGMGLLRAAALLLGLLFALLAFAFGADWLLRPDNFPVRHVRFEGEFRHVTQAALEEAVKNVVHGNFFLIDLDAVKARVEALPWVYRASVRRQWPQDLYVRFTEQQLVARWNDAAFLNPAGEVVRVAGPDLPADLPQLDGPEGSGAQVLEQYRIFGGILAAAGLTLQRLTLTPRHTWRLALAGGIAIVIDRAQSQEKLERFARVYVQSLAPMAAHIKQVDLRYTNGFAVAWQDGHAGSETHDAQPRLGRSGAGRADTANKG